MKTTPVIIPFEVAIGFTVFPVAWRLDAVPKCTIVKYRQVETTAIPGNEIGCVAIDTVEESSYELGFI